MVSKAGFLVVALSFLVAGCSETPVSPSAASGSSTSSLAKRPGSTRPLTGTATFGCATGDGICAPTGLAGALNSNGEMLLSNVQSSMVLAFNGQRPEDSPDPHDCSIQEGNCLWDWSADPRSEFDDFDIQNNTLDAGGNEVGNGLLGMTDGPTYTARFNMTIRVPETESFWRFDFNPLIPADGGGDVVNVTRTGCTWQFSAVDGQRAALSTVVKPAKGKSYIHHEGTFEMPFTLIFQLDEDSCTAIGS